MVFLRPSSSTSLPSVSKNAFHFSADRVAAISLSRARHLTHEKMASGDFPPVFSDVAAFSFGNKLNQGKYESLISSFQQRFACQPQFLVRAPGRVNVIGEHVDYSGYGVLPMAIAQDIAMAFCVDEGGECVELAHQSPTYQPQQVTFTSDPATAPITGHHWFEYAMCGVRGIAEKGFGSRKGIRAMMCGNVPPSAGLSSSSAVVCCAALMMNVAYAASLSKQEIATMCAVCERYIGTQGGGMDQAISFLAQPGTAKYIQFNPLRTSDVPLPKGAAFVVANSLVKANKAATTFFNERVVECRLGAKVIARQKQLDWQACSTLGQLQEALGVDLPAMLQVVEDCLHPQAFSKEEVCTLLGIDEAQLKKTCLSANTLDMTQFHLYKRAKHAYSEALRVVEFHRIAKEAAQSGKTPEQVLIELGQLMNDSHVSCRDLYQCSCPELDRLVEICNAQPGAYGARLTGAGWGGCMVALVAEEVADGFIEAVKSSGFYEGQQTVDSSVIFATQPGAGAAILKI